MSPRRRRDETTGDLWGQRTGEPSTGTARRYEMHTHSYVSGPYANREMKVEHSHEGGDVQHEHPDTGPASYVIDKDRWYAMTGFVGGGRKKFTKKPSGPQLEYITRTPEQDTFEIIVCESSHGEPVQNVEGGGGFLTAARMVQGHKMTPRLRIER